MLICVFRPDGGVGLPRDMAERLLYENQQSVMDTADFINAANKGVKQQQNDADNQRFLIASFKSQVMICHSFADHKFTCIVFPVIWKGGIKLIYKRVICLLFQRFRWWWCGTKSKTLEKKGLFGILVPATQILALVLHIFVNIILHNSIQSVSQCYSYSQFSIQLSSVFQEDSSNLAPDEQEALNEFEFLSGEGAYERAGYGKQPPSKQQSDQGQGGEQWGIDQGQLDKMKSQYR